MIIIYMNSKKISLDNPMSLHDVLEMNGLSTGSFAVAINRQFISRGRYVETWMNNGDQIEIVFPMQGG